MCSYVVNYQGVMQHPWIGETADDVEVGEPWRRGPGAPGEAAEVDVAREMDGIALLDHI